LNYRHKDSEAVDTVINLANRRVLVTGGAKGVGAGISARFIEAGANVIMCGRQLPEKLTSSLSRAHFITADVRDDEAVGRMFTQIENEHGGLDVLVNNAGGAPYALADSASPRFHEAILRLNLIAPLLIAQHANRLMQEQQAGGVIVFIGSVSGLRPSPGTAAYGAAKAGIVSLTQSLAVEWAPKVRVVAVSPGFVRTEQADLHYGNAAGQAAVAASLPLARLAEPGDIGAACVFLASTQASYISGANLVVHGGGERPPFLDAAKAHEA
jgi:NAD(P)-dependent dehydrogenase (short-subunit alcohol dehydrogenase family)